MPSPTVAPVDRSSRHRGMLEPLHRFRTVIVIGVAVILVLIVVAKAAAASASWARVELPFDQALSRGHVPALDTLSLTIEWLLSPVQGLVIVVLVSLIVLWKTRDRMVFLTFLLVVAGGWLSSELVKIVVHRARPDYHLLAHPLSTEVNFASFPSGHTCLATALAVGFVLLLRGRPIQKWAIVFGAVGVLIVAWSRLYIGAHYPSDVLGSMIYTTAAMLVFLAVWNQWLRAPLERALTRPRARRRH